MKKTILFLALAFLGIFKLYSQEFNVGKFLISQNKESVTADIEVKVNPSLYFWKLNITNTSSENIIIDWDKSTFVLQGQSSSLVFDDTIKLFINQPKGKEVISPDSFIIKSVYPKNKTETMMPLFSKRDVEKGLINNVLINLNFDKNGEEINMSLPFTIGLKQ